MAYENNERNQENIYSKKVRAGKRRTYFFDIKETRANDYFLTITESRKRFDDNGYDRHKIFVYKEDFNKFIKSLTEAVDYVKTELMPNFDFDVFNHEYPENQENIEINESKKIVDEQSEPINISETQIEEKVEEEKLIPEIEKTEIDPTISTNHETVDKW